MIRSLLLTLALPFAFAMDSDVTMIVPREVAITHNQICSQIAFQTHARIHGMLAQDLTLPYQDKINLLNYSFILCTQYSTGALQEPNLQELTPNQYYILMTYMNLPLRFPIQQPTESTARTTHIPEEGTAEFDAAVVAGEIFPPETYYDKHDHQQLTPGSFFTEKQLAFIRNHPTWTTVGIANSMNRKFGSITEDQRKKLTDPAVTLVSLIEQVRHQQSTNCQRKLGMSPSEQFKNVPLLTHPHLIYEGWVYKCGNMITLDIILIA